MNPNYFNDDQHINTIVEVMKIVYNLSLTPPLQQYGAYCTGRFLVKQRSSAIKKQVQRFQ